MILADINASRLAEGLLIGGVVVQYIATRIALSAAESASIHTTGRRTLAQWLPVASTAIAALATGHLEIAVALILGSSVACLSLLLGMNIAVSPMRQLSQRRRVWPLVLPAAMLLLLAGFHGSFTWYHAIMLVVMGGAFGAVWLEKTLADQPGEAAVPLAHLTDAVKSRGSFAFVVLALVLASGGAWAVAAGAAQPSMHARLMTPQLLGACIVSPLLLLPALGNGSILAQQGRTEEAVTALCGTVLLNLCALLPLIVLVHYLVGAIGQVIAGASLMAALRQGPVTPLSIVSWRVDCVLILLLAFVLAPLSSSRWVPGRFESVLLVIVYMGYLVAETWYWLHLQGALT